MVYLEEEELDELQMEVIEQRINLKSFKESVEGGLFRNNISRGWFLSPSLRRSTKCPSRSLRGKGTRITMLRMMSLYRNPRRGNPSNPGTLIRTSPSRLSEVEISLN